jgi:hypothetical protein
MVAAPQRESIDDGQAGLRLPRQLAPAARRDVAPCCGIALLKRSRQYSSRLATRWFSEREALGDALECGAGVTDLRAS